MGEETERLFFPGESFAETRRSELVLICSRFDFVRLKPQARIYGNLPMFCFHIWKASAIWRLNCNSKRNVHDMRSPGMLIVELRFVCCLWVFLRPFWFLYNFVSPSETPSVGCLGEGEQSVLFRRKNSWEIQLENEFWKKQNKIWRKMTKLIGFWLILKLSKLLNLA